MAAGRKELPQGRRTLWQSVESNRGKNKKASDKEEKVKNSRWFRLWAVALSATLFFSATAAGLKPVVSSSARWIGLLLQGRPPQFTQRPGPIYCGPNPTRDPEFRGGIWTP
ncbi:MAG: hypothetical protein AB1725_05180, partial [Armatimonadota bacterium]